MKGVSLLATALLAGCNAYASRPPVNAVKDAPIAHFARVRDGLYRGGHPSAAGLDYLKAHGVRTIVDLEVADLVEASPGAIHDEERGAKVRGIRWVHAPMSAFEPALSGRFDAQVDRLMTVLADPHAGPVYVHCLHGQDRTGLVIGLERVIVEGWTPGRAHAEMVRDGFHTAFAGLDGYFERKTHSEADR